MSKLAHDLHYTYAEYVALERFSNVRHEYLDGQIYAMAGGTPEHAALTAALTVLLAGELRGNPCRGYSADVRIRTRSGLSTYPDLAVVCGDEQRDAEDRQAITNPTLIAEVLSRSTAEYDRGQKFEHYKSLASLREYILVSQTERQIEVWTRSDDDGWQRKTVRDGETAQLVIGTTLSVRELYDIATAASAARP
jgi:Uma2 family endonuclease